jgi:hypothetical protein
MQTCIVAEHASTHFGGEAFLPLRYFSLVHSRGIDTWLVVHSRTLRELEGLFPRDLNRIFFVPDLWIQKAMGTAGRERAVRDFDWQRRIDAMVGIYDVLVKKPVLVRS